jgi:hypothetical protein
MADLKEFYCGSNEPSHASQFKWLEYTFKCKCEKNCTFSNILQKVKSFFFANIYHSPFDSH